MLCYVLRHFLTFSRAVVSSPSASDTTLQCLDPKDEGTMNFKMSGITYPLTKCNIPEGQYLQK